MVVEATASSEWFVRLVEPTADRVVLSHPGHLPVVAQSKRKTDKLDAQTLAEFLALDQISEAWREALDVIPISTHPVTFESLRGHVGLVMPRPVNLDRTLQSTVNRQRVSCHPMWRYG